MSDISEIEQLLERLRSTDNAELAEQRDLLLDGGAYRQPEVRQQYPIDTAEVTLSRDEPSQLEVPVAADEVAATIGQDTVAAFVIGARSFGLANVFELLIQLGAGDDFLAEPDPTDERYVALVGFFDGDGAEHDDQHSVDDRGLAVTTAPFGHFTLDASAALTALARRDPNARPVIQLSLIVGESHQNREAMLTIADLSLATIAV